MHDPRERRSRVVDALLLRVQPGQAVFLLFFVLSKTLCPERMRAIHSKERQAQIEKPAEEQIMRLMQGAKLTDADGLLEGTGTNMQQVKWRSIEQVKGDNRALCRLIEDASRMNERFR